MRLSTLALCLIAPVAVNAAVLLEINVSNAAEVTITSTGLFADADDSTRSLYDGVNLDRFLTDVPPPGPNPTVLGNLTPTGSPIAYSLVFWDDYSGSMVDLNLFNEHSEYTQSFSTSARAFTGAATIDLSDIATLLPTAGTTGSIFAGYSGNATAEIPLTEIGQWRVVAIPEPSTYAAFLGVAALAAAVLLRRRRR